jgi:putative Holliday junction resolvase
VKIVALDYGEVRTGVAVSDATGTLARPLGVVRRAATDAGLARLAELVDEHEAALVVVGMPLTLRGERGRQAMATESFVHALRGVLAIPVETFDERFTTALAAQTSDAAFEEDARAAAHLLAGYLRWAEAARG